MELAGPMTAGVDWKGIGGELGIEVREHPIIRLPDGEQVRTLMGSAEGRKALGEMLAARAQRIRMSEADPLRYGSRPWTWEEADKLLAAMMELLVMGGNRSSKSEWAAEKVVKDVAEKPKRIWACLHSSEDSCRRQQHPRIYKFLPPEWRDLGKRGKTTFVCYTQKGGFTDNTVILPNGSAIYFFNYRQDPRVLEGYEFDGWWADELVPPMFIQTLRFRTVTRRGKGILTFTPTEGYTPAVGEYLGAARITRSLKSELLPGQNVKGCPAGEMPFTMQCVHPKRAVIFFFSIFNRFSSYEELTATLEGQPTPEVKIRAYGWPDRAKGNIFPKFGAQNIVPKERIPRSGTNYFYGDFAWARNWFLLWLRVQEFKGKKRVFVWREWPDFQTYGEWVLSSNRPDGDRGPAQKPLGFGYRDYKKLIYGIEREAQVKVFERRCDPRSGKAAAISDEGGTCIIDKLGEEHTDETGKTLPGMTVLPASGDDIQDGVNQINAWLEYDDSRPVDMDNEPVLYISEECRNLIDCLRMWTGADGLKGASKDPIDVLRYAAQDGIEEVPEGGVVSRGGGGY